jgi:hypothetical protein
MESSHKIIEIDDIKTVIYNNLYYIGSTFYYLTIDDVDLVAIGTLGTAMRCNDNATLCPNVKKFTTLEDLEDFVNSIVIEPVPDVTNFVHHFYDHNIAHAIYDTLYPSYLSCLRCNTEFETYNMFVETLYVRGWSFPGNASREYSLDVFKTFCGGKFIHKRIHDEHVTNYKFDVLVSGQENCGISCVNKKGIMPGGDINAMEKFRDRMYLMYNILPTISDKLRVKFIMSRRYTSEEITIIQHLCEEYSDVYECQIIDWSTISSFKEQLQISCDTDIHLSGAGTSMLNYPFMLNKTVHINLGVKEVHANSCPSLFEVNVCLLTPHINVFYYDVFRHVVILYEPLKEIFEQSLTHFGKNMKQKIPNYILIWQEYCIKDPNSDKLIIKMMGPLIGERFPEIVVLEINKYSEQYRTIDNLLMRSIKKKYSSLV